MKAKLTPENIKELKVSCRTGIFISLGLLIIGLLFLSVNILIEQNDNQLIKLNNRQLLLAFGLLLTITFILGYMLTEKFIADIRNGEKLLIKKIVEQKTFYIHHEPGSGSLQIGQKMNAYDSYNLIIDGQRHNVKKELFDKVEEGGTVFFHIAPISQELLQIDIDDSQVS